MENKHRPMYKGDSYPDWDGRDLQAIAREEGEKEAELELNEVIRKEYADLLIKDTDGVDRSHYQTTEIQPIEIIEMYGLNFNLGNAIKYILRAPFKGSFNDDLRKSIWYLNREISTGNKN